ncbi:N-acetyl-gamma-glutamyl-phosphate reductase [Methanobacterium petrolearium]|uniref:N-acetyl-gamma-glutamyl-phosphate reductase n=1 Tax=Methanobacterium petrolearium TaxID=710190 RepID=UPI001AE45D65|nr:N-acetyl-gamma-glutamyl-phosphate reductase [Methanobacterium petrolearium]MBP1945415.1 N-acetyl-gamma-glutamyl-phosphate reductase [Methanobacterium petrolearium]BDZ71611.1 N-acetyl-gamma-glutamyl-phosphate reductase [Methanobacterium petrolearium]
MLEVAIIGASGYTGGELLRFLDVHSKVEVVAATSRQYADTPIRKVHPHLHDLDLNFLDKSPSDLDVDLAFTATPHGASMNIVPELVEKGIKVVDLSGDYRFDDIAIYEKWYGLKHKKPLEAVYGLPEMYREEIKRAYLVANPGCYPTGAILAGIPLVKNGITDTLIADSKSGVSGAGINPTPVTHYPNIGDNLVPYAVTTHRHMPEIQEKLQKYGNVRVSFTPHLIPAIRGIITTLHCFPNKEITPSEVQEIYKEEYQNEPFIRVLEEGEIPRLSSVRGSNFCHIGCFEIDENGRLVVISAIDNLVKGASGVAVQNMNLMCGFPETMSLEAVGLHP